MLKDFFEKLNTEGAAEKEAKLLAYMEGVLEWNEKVNLTAITNRDDFIEKHFLDSLTLCGKPELEEADRIIDVGTGGGFPGIPLAVAYPEKSFVLMDSLAKRLRIIDELCEKLEIRNVTTLHGRAEEVAKLPAYRESFDLCVSRAVADLAVLSELCLPFVRTGGCFAAYKTAEYESELAGAKKAIAALGGKVAHTELCGGALKHSIIYVSKVSATPKKYPRKPGDPAKMPIR